MASVSIEASLTYQDCISFTECLVFVFSKNFDTELCVLRIPEINSENTLQNSVTCLPTSFITRLLINYFVIIIIICMQYKDSRNLCNKIVSQLYLTTIPTLYDCSFFPFHPLLNFLIINFISAAMIMYLGETTSALEAFLFTFLFHLLIFYYYLVSSANSQ